MVHPVVKGDVVGQIIEVPFLRLGGHDGAGHFPDIVDTLSFILSHGLWGGVRAQIPAGRPDYNEFLILVVHHFDDGQILRLDTLALIEHILQVAVHFFRGDAL